MAAEHGAGVDGPEAPRGRTGRRAAAWRTVRFRLTALATVVVAIALATTAYAVVRVQRETLHNIAEETLEQRANAIEVDVLDGSLPADLPRGTDDDSLSQLVAADGEVIATSRNLDPREERLGPLLDAEDPQQFVEITGSPIDPSAPFLLLARRIETPEGPVWLYVADNLDDVRESVDTLQNTLRVAIPLVTAALAALLWWLTGRMLRPVEAIRREVAAIDGTALERRVPVPPTDDEIGNLARTMNAMLDRVEEANQRQRRFVADASHELRSPLTRMRSELEVDLTHPETADPAATQRSVLAETIGLQHLVDDLLHLARSDDGAGEPAREPVDLDDLVLREARRMRERGRVQIDTSGVSAAQILGDSAQLGRVVRNLAENAERHARSRVRLAVADEADGAALTITDDGPGIAPEHREVVFERFTRLDGARTREAGGAGVGLAIVRDIVDRHGGTVTVDDEPGGGARFTVRLPH